jgi:ribose 5-phosphate isomerase
VVVADYRKQSKLLGEKWRKGVPVEVIPISYKPLMRKFETLGACWPFCFCAAQALGASLGGFTCVRGLATGGRPVLRMGEPAKAGPCVTDNGNFLIDVDFGTIADPEGLHKEIKLLAGVVETGLFINMAEKGSATSLARPTHAIHGCVLCRACLFCSRVWYPFGVGGRSLLRSGGRNGVGHHQALSQGMK